MGGGKTQSENTASTITNEQLGILRDQNALSKQNYERMVTGIQPAVSRYTAMASGDRPTVMSAVAPQAEQIDKAYGASKDSIFNSIAPGPARDFALAKLSTGGNAAKAGMVNEAVTSAPDKLASIAQGLGAYSLQEVAAALRGGEGAANTNQSVMQSETARNQAKLGFFGNLASAATAPFSISGKF